MSYIATIAALDTQFNCANYEFNLIDDQGIYPNQRRSFKFKKSINEITEEELQQVKNTICQEAADQAQIELDKEADLEFMQQFIPLVEDGLEALRLELLNKVKTENNLSESQIKIAENVIFSWKVNE